MNFAIKSLIETPQNNFRIFKNGTLIYGDNIIKDVHELIAQFFCTKDDDNKRLVSTFSFTWFGFLKKIIF